MTIWILKLTKITKTGEATIPNRGDDRENENTTAHSSSNSSASSSDWARPVNPGFYVAKSFVTTYLVY